MAETIRHSPLLVIGAGPGGYAAAFHAADHGLAVTLVNSDPAPGGVCLNRGCIPSKALLHVAKVLHEAKEAGQWGLIFDKPRIDLARMRDWKNEVVRKLAGSIQQLCGMRKVTLLRAKASFVDSNSLRLEPGEGATDVPTRLTFDHAIVATGSLPAIPPNFNLKDPRVMDSTAALELTDIPPTLLVIGGGYIGLELGSVYAALGSAVTVVELTDGLLPGADRDLVIPLRKRLQGMFKAIHLSTKVESLEAKPEGIVAKLNGPEGASSQTFARVLVSVGRRPNSRALGLEHTQVQMDERGFIKIDGQQRTTDPKILAIGDVAGEPMLAHKATREGKVAAEAILGHATAFDVVAIPAVVFTDPEIAWCGLTETEAKATKRNVKVVRFPWAASGRAQTLGRTDGSTKLIVDPTTEQILGMGIVGPGAGELIAEGVLAVETAAVARDIADSIHPHPTLSETIAETAEAIFGQATHLYRQ